MKLASYFRNDDSDFEDDSDIDVEEIEEKRYLKIEDFFSKFPFGFSSICRKSFVLFIKKR